MKKARYYQFSSNINAQLKQLSHTDNYHTILALLIDYFFIFMAILLSSYCHYFYPLSLLIIGSRQRALATILHEAAHNRAASNKILNQILGKFMSGFWIFQSFDAYKHSHVRLHHTFLGDPTHDPDFQFHIKQGLYQGMDRRKFFISEVLLAFLCMKSWPYIIYFLKNRFLSLREHPRELMQTAIFWCVISLLLTTYHLWSDFLLFWIIPYFSTFIIIDHFIELAEHFPLLDGKENHPLVMTRNRFSHWFENFFLGIHYENYHLTHHLRPGVPFWRMPEAHALMMQDAHYREVNQHVGGIFLSSNKHNLALIPSLITGAVTLPQTLQYTY